MSCVGRLAAVVLALVLSVGWCRAAQYTGTETSTRLYTKPDPEAGGGLRGRIVGAAMPVLQVLAIRQGDQKKVYESRVTPGAQGDSFEIAGMPADRYDLLIVCDDRFYEGLLLSTEPDTLTDKDRKSIEAKTQVSVPFFNEKRVHRIIGATGQAGQSRAVLQYLRSLPVTLQSAVVRSDIQIRSLRLGWYEDVGPGWQQLATREIVRTEVTPKDTSGLIGHQYLPELSGFRVIDTVKDLGDINLKSVQQH